MQTQSQQFDNRDHHPDDMAHARIHERSPHQPHHTGPQARPAHQASTVVGPHHDLDDQQR